MTRTITKTRTIPYSVNYDNLTFAHKQYETLDKLISVVAQAYAKRDFATALLLAQSMGVDLTREELAELLIDVKKSMIKTSLAKHAEANDLFNAA